MIPAEAIPHHALASPHWEARLGLEYVKRAERTVLARRSHSGPLRVQRDLYPEGEGICHTIVVHPPGGVAGGDSLSINAILGLGSAALLTTPGAGKWYRTQARPARQALEFDVADGASLEWLPQETILFDGTSAEMKTTVRLQRGAVYTGWEVLCFGRTASGHRFETGRLSQQTNILLEDEQLWAERWPEVILFSPRRSAWRGTACVERFWLRASRSRTSRSLRVEMCRWDRERNAG